MAGVNDAVWLKMPPAYWDELCYVRMKSKLPSMYCPRAVWAWLCIDAGEVAKGAISGAN